jgi:hypothetical protein
LAGKLWTTPASDIVVEHSEFERNGAGDGQSHNIYIGELRSFTLRYSYSHDANKSQLVKSRAVTNYILYNRIVDRPDGNANYEIDLSNGGVSYIILESTDKGVKLRFRPIIIGSRAILHVHPLGEHPSSRKSRGGR